MQSNPVKGATLAIVGLGIVLSLINAVQPHFGAGYRIDVLLLLAGIAPYAMFGILSGTMTDAGANGTGLGVLLIHLALIIAGGTAALLGPPLMAAVLFLLILFTVFGSGDGAAHDDHEPGH